MPKKDTNCSQMDGLPFVFMSKRKNCSRNLYSKEILHPLYPKRRSILAPPRHPVEACGLCGAHRLHPHGTMAMGRSRGLRRVLVKGSQRQGCQNGERICCKNGYDFKKNTFWRLFCGERGLFLWCLFLLWHTPLTEVFLGPWFSIQLNRFLTNIRQHVLCIRKRNKTVITIWWKSPSIQMKNKQKKQKENHLTPSLTIIFYNFLLDFPLKMIFPFKKKIHFGNAKPHQATDQRWPSPGSARPAPCPRRRRCPRLVGAPKKKKTERGRMKSCFLKSFFGVCVFSFFFFSGWFIFGVPGFDWFHVVVFWEVKAFLLFVSFVLVCIWEEGIGAFERHSLFPESSVALASNTLPPRTSETAGVLIFSSDFMVLCSSLKTVVRGEISFRVILSCLFKRLSGAFLVLLACHRSGHVVLPGISDLFSVSWQNHRMDFFVFLPHFHPWV